MEEHHEHVVYILQSLANGSYYVGYTSFLMLRIREHQEGGLHTSKGIPWVVEYVEFYNNKTDALKREKQIKKMKSRRYIENLIENMNAALSSR